MSSSQQNNIPGATGPSDKPYEQCMAALQEAEKLADSVRLDLKAREENVRAREASAKIREDNVNDREDRISAREDRINAREREIATTGIARIVSEAEQKFKEVGQLTNQGDRSDRLDHDIRNIPESIANLALQSQEISQQQVNTLAVLKGMSNSLEEKFGTYSGLPAIITNKIDELKQSIETTIPAATQINWANVDLQLDSIIDKIDAIKGDISTLARRNTTTTTSTSSAQLTRSKK
ncbi:MAG: hypothetical protein Q9226_000814 [Calogaya cf. arnoldii]